MSKLGVLQSPDLKKNKKVNPNKTRTMILIKAMI